MMQLQIQTVQKIQKQSQKQSRSQGADLIFEVFPQTKSHDPSLSLLTQLRQIQFGIKADYHYFNRLMSKTFKAICEEDFELQMETLQKAFLSLKFSLLEKRINNNKKKVFINYLFQNAAQRRKKLLMKKKGDEVFRINLMKKIFEEYSSFLKVQKVSKTFQIFSIKNKRIEFLSLLQQNLKRSRHRKSKELKEQVQINKILSHKILIKYFIALKLFKSYSILEKLRKKKILKSLKIKIFQIQKQKLTKIQNFQQKHYLSLLKKVFQILRENKLQSQCFDWHSYRVQRKYFNKWVKQVQILKNQKQLQAYNQVIVQHFIDSKKTSKKNKVLTTYFSLWKQITIFSSHQKKEAQILKSFAELKQKQYLERKYFTILKQNKNYQKSIKFFEQKLKRKTLQKFKKNVIVQSQKIFKVYQFIQKRSIKKYFDQIKIFNQSQKEKIKIFKLKTQWLKFTFNVTESYFLKNQKAQTYYETLLKFKSLIGLKETVQFNKKSFLCQQSIRIILPLRKWYFRFKYLKFIQKKQVKILKKIIFEWKILTLRKSLSSENLVFNSQLFVQSRITSKKEQTFGLQNSIFSQCKKEISSQIQRKQASFFMKMDDDESEDDQQIQKKVDSLLKRIKEKKKLSLEQLQVTSWAQVFTNQKLKFANKSIDRNYTNESVQRLRVPTWNSPETAQRVSIFKDEIQDN